MAHRIVHLEKQKVALEAFDPAPLAAGQIRVRSICSLLSTGTEGIIYGRLFEPGSHWDEWVKYPMYAGYATIGQVTEIAEGVTGRHVGQRVAVRKPHASQIVVDAADTYPVPEGVDTQQAAWFALGKIAFHGAQAADFRIAQSVAIIGAGPLGQMATRWAADAGVGRLVVIDTVAERLKMARAGGATDVLAAPVQEVKDGLWSACGGKGPDVVMDVTGHAGVLAPALALPRMYGKVVILGDTGSPSDQHLTRDVVIRGVQIVGAHDGHNTDRWNNATIIDLFLRHVAAGRIKLDGLITHTFSPKNVADAFEFARTRRQETMGLLIDWTEFDGD